MMLPEPISNGQPAAVWLLPRKPTRLPGTACELWWDGDRAVFLYRHGGNWDISSLTVTGRVLLWQRVASRPQLGWWPVLPLASRATYQANASHRHRHAPAG